MVMIVAGLPYVSMENQKVVDAFQPVINNNDTLSKVRWLLGKLVYVLDFK